MVVVFETSRNSIPAPDERPGHDGQPAERKAPNGKSIEQGCRLSGEAQCAYAPRFCCSELKTVYEVRIIDKGPPTPPDHTFAIRT